MSIWFTVVAVAGTLLAAVFTQLFQARSAAVARRENHRHEWRRESVDAVAALMAAFANHRMRMWIREEIRLAQGENDHYAIARRTSHETRNAIDFPLERVRILVPDLAALAEVTASSIYALRDAPSMDQLDYRRGVAIDMMKKMSAAAADLLRPQ